MLPHLRANLCLLFLTLFLCCVLYPLTLWGIGQTIFHDRAEGSMLTGVDKQPVGSRLIAQAFSGDEFFQPRPSATSPSYNAAASGGSNLSANNPKLRGRVAQQLGPIVRYASVDGPGKGRLVGDKVEAWFQSENDLRRDTRRDLTAEWAKKNPSLIAGWATSSEFVTDYVKKWTEAWKAKNPDSSAEPKPEDIAPLLFDPSVSGSFVKVHPGMWPCTVEEEKDGKKVKRVKPDNKGDDIRSIFFDMWLQEHPGDAKLLEPVPADMVMTSGSGLDPHITLKNALYQLERVAAAWADKTKRDPATLRLAIRELLTEKTEAPLGGLVGVPLINVLEVNLALVDRMQK